MKKASLFTAAALAGLGMGLASAQTVDVSILWQKLGSSSTETFQMNLQDGLADGLGPEYVFYYITDDNLGNNSIFFGDSSTNGSVGTGLENCPTPGCHVVLATNWAFFSPALYSGSGLVAWIAPGNTYYANPLDGLDAVMTVTSVPEASTWAMMLAGFAGLGLAGWRASRKSAAAA